MNVRENETLPILPTLANAGFVATRREEDLANEFSQKLRVKAPTIEAGVLGLSGGNQQKVVLAKWLAAECD
ncbi:ABC transporter ATP-binding protein, partial [Acinetobacter baumannii]